MFTITTTNKHTLFIINLALVNYVLADYCEFGICETDQYCCGDNKCCKKKADLWYFWAAILLIVIAIAVGFGLYFKMRNKRKYDNYVQVAT